MSRPLLNVSQSDSLIQIVDINSHTEWQTVQIWIYTVCEGRVYPHSAGHGLTTKQQFLLLAKITCLNKLKFKLSIIWLVLSRECLLKVPKTGDFSKSVLIILYVFLGKKITVSQNIMHKKIHGTINTCNQHQFQIKGSQQ